MRSLPLDHALPGSRLHKRGLGWESKSLYESTRWGKGIGELFVVLRHGIGRDLMRGIRRGLFHSVVQEEVSDQHPMFPYDRSKH